LAVYNGWPEEGSFAAHCDSFIPFLAKQPDLDGDMKEHILQDLKSCHEMVDVSCFSGESFTGIPSEREKIDMKASDFVGGWTAERQQETHWSLNSGLRLYLSQCCVISAEDASLQELPQLADVVTVPTILQRSHADVSQVNLWMNIQAVTSSLHYDSYQNILLLLSGQKDVKLYSPAMTQFLSPAPASSDFPNYSAKAGSQLAAVPGISVAMIAGDALFIPEGWWHQVESSSCALAVNYWFGSAVKRILCAVPYMDAVRAEHTGGRETAESQRTAAHSSHMAAYLLRASLHHLLSQDRDTSSSEAGAPMAALNPAYSSMTPQLFAEYIDELLLLQADSDSKACVGLKRKLVNASTEQDEGWLGFVRCSMQFMKDLWLPFARQVSCHFHIHAPQLPDNFHKPALSLQHPQRWVQVLLSLSPKASAHLLGYWDSVDADATDNASFFSEIFAPCGDRISEVRRHLIMQKDRLNAERAANLVRRILGSPTFDGI
jgi:hypothetical protein